MLQACVEIYFATEQITTDTTYKLIKDYHSKNDSIKDVKIGFEPLSGDVAGRVENEGAGTGVNICYRFLHSVFAGGIVSTHCLQPRT